MSSSEIVEENALFVVGAISAKMNREPATAEVLLDTGADGWSYISSDAAKLIPLAMRRPIDVEGRVATNATFICSETISFWLQLPGFENHIFITALIMPELQYDVIVCAQDIMHNKLGYYLLDKLTMWIKNEPDATWKHPGSIASIQVISNDSEDSFGDLDAFPYHKEDSPVVDVPHYEGTTDLQRSFSNLVEKYDDIFKDSVTSAPAKVTPFDLKLLPGTVMPKAMRAKARVHCTEHEASIESQVQELTKLGVIRQFNGEFYSQVLLVRKADGTLRFCIDFRFLNNISEHMKWPLPCIHTMLRRVGNHRYYTVLDLTSGYHQCPMTSRAQKLTAFITARGLHHFTRLPFGLKGAPSYFQWVMANEVLKGLCYEICEVYIDDIIIFGDTPEEILDRTAQVFERFRSFNIHIKKSKCRFGLQSIQYVGHILSKEGISMSEERKAAVLGIPRPTTIGQLRTFLGMTGYFRQFIQNYAHIVGPLHALNSVGNKNRSLAWSPDTILAFESLRTAVHNAARIEHLEPDGVVKLYTDASDYAIGAHLVQLDNNGVERTISFASQLLDRVQRNWSVTDKEMYAVIMAVTKFNLFVGGRPFIVMIDHQNLQFWQTSSASPKVERWRQHLSTYDLKYNFLPGIKNVVADAMSRLIEQPTHIAAASTRKSTIPTFDISTFHSGEAGHFKLDTTVAKLRAAGINYPGMITAVRKFIESCPICQRLAYKKPIQGHTFTLQHPQPDELVSVDTMGPIDVDKYGYCYVLVLIDNCSKFTRLFPIKSTKAEECAPRLLEYICRDGLPKKIHSDGGSQFVNDLITELATYLGVTLTFSTASSSEENGIVERVIKDVRCQLQSYCIERGSVNDWSLILPLVERLINTKISSRTGHTPAALKFGKVNALELPPFNTSNEETPVFTTASEYLESITKFQKSLIARHESSLAADIPKTPDQSATRNFNVFKKGDLILVDRKDRHKSKLLETLRLGPFLVIGQQQTKVSYEDHGTNRVKHTHISQCHLYHPRGTVEEELGAARELVDTFEVEHIVEHKFVPATSRAIKAVQLLVKWTGYAEPEWNTIYNNATLRNNLLFVEYAKRHTDLAHFIPKNVITTLN